ncbi:hypothetical protein WJU16_03170 [Chitinophaga pollutisoli]|uniref:Transposase n=1 Tax=Chitinophaga pollutisoli TaxID=3133966 RepID=A0ABZ2YRT1_9BACT
MQVNILDVRKLCQLIDQALKQDRIYVAVENRGTYVESIRFLKDSEMEQWYEHGDRVAYSFYKTKSLSNAFNELRRDHNKFDLCLRFEFDRLYYNMRDVLSFSKRCKNLKKLLAKYSAKHKNLAEVGFVKRKKIMEELSILSHSKWGEKYAIDTWKKYAPGWQIPNLFLRRAKKNQSKQNFMVRKSDFKNYFDVKIRRK